MKEKKNHPDLRWPIGSTVTVTYQNQFYQAEVEDHIHSPVGQYKLWVPEYMGGRGIILKVTEESVSKSRGLRDLEYEVGDEFETNYSVPFGHDATLEENEARGMPCTGIVISKEPHEVYGAGGKMMKPKNTYRVRLMNPVTKEYGPEHNYSTLYMHPKIELDLNTASDEDLGKPKLKDISSKLENSSNPNKKLEIDNNNL